MIETIRATITITNAVKVREEKIDNKEYLVAPLVAITEGVHTGSEGPILYEAAELSKFVANNDHRPLCLGHPKKGSAASKRFIETRGCGMTLNSSWDDTAKSLNMEAYVDKSAASAKDKRLLKNLASNTTTEVSTGYDLELEKTPGVWTDGTAYVGKAKNLHLDHVAILLDQKGACSIEKGAGLLRNAGDVEQKFWSELFKNAGELPESVVQCFQRSVENVLSFDGITRQITELLSAAYGEPGKYWEGYVREVFPDYAIFRTGYGSSCCLMKQEYTVADDVVTLTGTAVEVVQTTEYAVVGNTEKRPALAGSTDTVPTPGDTKDGSMFKKAEHIAALILAGVFNEADKPELEKWEDKALERIKIPKAATVDKQLADQIPAPANPGVKNADPAPALLPDWRKLVPTKELAMLDEMGVVYNEQLKTSIDIIKAAPGNKFTDAELAEFSPKQIRNMAAIIASTAPSVTKEQTNDPLYGMFWPGVNGRPNRVNNTDDPTPPAPGEGLGVLNMWADENKNDNKAAA